MTTEIVRDRQVTKKELVTFFFLTLALSIGYVVFFETMPNPDEGKEAAMAWYQGVARVIVWLPLTFAVLCSAVFRGKSGLFQLLGRLAAWKINIRWWLIALSLPVALNLFIAWSTDSLLKADLATYLSIWTNMFGFLFLLLLGEEVGWRGYAQPGLQHHFSPFYASLILGTLWGVWHYGVWYGLVYGLTADAGAAAFFLPWSTLMTISLAIIMCWLLNNTGASILIAVAFHASNNASLRLAEQGDYSLIGNVILMIVAIVVVTLNRKMFFTKPT